MITSRQPIDGEELSACHYLDFPPRPRPRPYYWQGWRSMLTPQRHWRRRRIFLVCNFSTALQSLFNSDLLALPSQSAAATTASVCFPFFDSFCCD